MNSATNSLKAKWLFYGKDNWRQKFMGDDSSKQIRSESVVNSLKHEWSLFWESIIGDEESDPFEDIEKLEALSAEKIKELTRLLSQDRKRLNQKLEAIQKEIELNTAKLDTIRLVGGSDQEARNRINELSDQGQNLSLELDRLNEKLSKVRNLPVLINDRQA